MLLDPTSGQKKIQEVAAGLRDRELPVVNEHAFMDEIVESMIRFGHSRILYVVDDENRLLGTISLGILVRNVFPSSHRPQIHPRRLMAAITTENARHIMQEHTVSARMDEEIEYVLQRMIKANVKEIAILDEENKVVGDITILDLLKFLSMHQAL
jgi:CBS domain-containing protein